MSLYTYKGQSLDGIIIKGEYEAINLQELIEYMHIRD